MRNAIHQEAPLEHTYLATIVSVAIAALLVAIATGVVHDYQAYLKLWDVMVSGQDPWIPIANDPDPPFNAYGPLQAVIGYSSALHPLAPKIIFTLASIGTFAVSLLAMSRTGNLKRRGRIAAIALLFPLSPLIIVHTYIYGLNDIGCALLCVIACEFRAREKLLWVGAALGLAALLKFYPLLFVPFLCVGRNGAAHIRPFLSATTVFFGVIAFCHVVIGWDVVTAITGGVDRDAKLLSPLRFAEPFASASGNQTLIDLIDHLISANALYVVGAAALVALWGWWTGQDWRTVMLLGMLAIFAVYKVGNPQFWIGWVAVLTWILAEGDDRRSVFIAKRLVPVALFLSLFSVVYFFSGVDERGFHLPMNTRVGYLSRTYGSVLFWGCILVSLFLARKELFKARWVMPKIRF